MHRRAILTQTTLLIIILNNASAKSASDSSTVAQVYNIVVTVKDCLRQKYPGLCLKERALDAINQTIYLDEPIVIGFIRIEKNSNYDWNGTDDNEVLPNEVSKRSMVLNNALYDKIREYFKSRTIRLDVDDAFEGRKKGGGGGGGMGGKGGGGKGKEMMMVAAVCMGTGMLMGKMGMMAMAAMMMSKISLLLSAIMMLKKSKGGGDDDGGKEKNIKIVYATTSGGGGDYGKGGGGGGGGGGGWHRSLNSHHEPQTITYRAQIPQDASANVVYEANKD